MAVAAPILNKWCVIFIRLFHKHLETSSDIGLEFTSFEETKYAPSPNQEILQQEKLRIGTWDPALSDEKPLGVVYLYEKYKTLILFGTKKPYLLNDKNTIDFKIKILIHRIKYLYLKEK